MANTTLTWRELLGNLTKTKQQRDYVAQVLGVNPYTIVRWVNGETTPRSAYIERLPSLFPAYKEIFEELLRVELYPLPSLPDSILARRFAIPAEYLAKVLGAYATTSGPYRAWTIRHMILSQALGVLDPDTTGMKIAITQCIPPAAGAVVRSLCERMEMGTPPWDIGINARLVLIGAESLAGWSVSQGSPGIVQDMEQGRGLLPMWPAYAPAMSGVAYPIQRAGKVAGSLVICSVLRHYFTSERLIAIETYANMLALSFQDHEFYETSEINLCDVPLLSYDERLAYSRRFNEAVQEVRKNHTPPLSQMESETIVLQQIEAAILGQSIQEEEL